MSQHVDITFNELTFISEGRGDGGEVKGNKAVKPEAELRAESLSWSISSSVCGDQNKLFKAKHDLFLNLVQGVFVPKPEQTISTAL